MNREALSLVESFVFVAQELNFQRGAAKMNIDRSALTRRIQKLEHLLGFTLFERTTREVSLTPAGRAFYESNTHILQDFGNSIDAARRIAEGKTGMLRVGYMAFAAKDLMPSAVADFQSANPDVDIKLEYIGTQRQKVALANDKIDIGFLIGPFDHSGFHSPVLDIDPLFVVMPAGHRLADLAEVRLTDLASEDIILGDLVEWEDYRWRISELFSGEGMPLRVGLEAPDTPAIVGLVSAGLGVTICPESLVGFFGADVEIRRISHPDFYIQTVLSWRRANRTKIVRQFAEQTLNAAKGRVKR